MIVSLVFALTAAASPIPAKPVKRCGWLENPTPGNWSLRDRDGEWELGMQGGYQAPGLDDLPDMSSKGTVETNGSHGYSCACLTVTTNPRTRRVTRIYGGAPLPLRQCRADRRLPKM